MAALPTLEQLLAYLEEATQSVAGTLSRDAQGSDLEGLDSMGMVMFLGIVQEHCDLELPVEELRECARVEDIAQALAHRER